MGFTRMSVRGINKAKRELGFVLIALIIRKVTAQSARNYLFYLFKNFMSWARFHNVISI